MKLPWFLLDDVLEQQNIASYGAVQNVCHLSTLEPPRWHLVGQRAVAADCKDTIKAAADGLQRNGFINYYGLQLQCLKKSPGNYLQALKAIPRTLRMIYK
ncbi:tRNA pseudouridine synthase D (TruD) [Musa troglodytarum]|uniref:tRNA pseudouridine synthase D (TruD) n=1 Tax=Musa troglodytarum TaxID=320322 RepID=A0A9E7JXU7_9LILI|nr:tRNA pseudouridine synthase D (TruD) [Musa troglodytarum]